MNDDRGLMTRLLMLGAALVVTNPPAARLVAGISADVERLLERLAALEPAPKVEASRRRRRAKD